MIRSPAEGQFWQVDHIQPVYSGGGQCSLENLQTLCTACHREVSVWSWESQPSHREQWRETALRLPPQPCSLLLQNPSAHSLSLPYSQDGKAALNYYNMTASFGFGKMLP